MLLFIAFLPRISLGSAFMNSMLMKIWGFRYFIVASVRSEIYRRFARSKLGAVWTILNPLAQAAIFAVVLSEVLATKLPGVSLKAGYAIYLMAGLAAWSLFGEITNRCMTIFIEYGGSIKKISFPRLCLPIIVGGSALINHFFLLSATLLVFLMLGQLPGIAWLAIPFGIFLTSVIAFGVGVLLGIFNVFVRDVGQVFAVAIQLWFWTTPIIYTPEILPINFRWLIDINPMAPIVAIYQDAMLYNRFPDWPGLAVPSMVAFGLFFLAFAVFRRASSDLIDAL
jgi:lipopolysaccharide transport system permease protein